MGRASALAPQANKSWERLSLKLIVDEHCLKHNKVVWFHHLQNAVLGKNASISPLNAEKDCNPQNLTYKCI